MRNEYDRENVARRSVRHGLRVGLGALLVLFVVSGCGEDDEADTPGDDTGVADTGAEDTGGADTEGDTEADTVADTDDGEDADGGVETARAMIVHNAADPAASTVDVFLDGELLIDDFEFRTALPFSDVPAGEHTIAIAGSDTGSAGEDTTLDSGETALGSFDLTFEADAKYLAVATGVRPNEGFESNPDGAEIGLDLKVKPMAKEASGQGDDTDELIAFHGVTDAPAIDARLDNAAQAQISGLGYGSFTDYLPVSSGVHTVDVEIAANGSRVASLQTGDLPGGEAWVVVASGFVTPDNDNDGEPLALVAFQAQTSSETDIIEGVPLEPAARAQIVHAAPQSAVETVDIWEKNAGTKLVDDLGYETATPFVTLPAGQTLTVGVAPQDSMSPGATLTSQDVEFTNGETSVLIASGVTDPSSFENVDTANFAIRKGEALESGSTSSSIDLNIFHGSTDAPTVDVVTSGGTTLASQLSFGSFSGIVSGVPAADYTVEVQAGGSTAASFDVPLSGAGGAYRTVVASGFLTAEGDPVSNPTFKLLAVAPDGSVTPIPPN